MLFVPIWLLGLTFLSGWIRRDEKIWIPLLSLSLLSGWMMGYLSFLSLAIVFSWAALWFAYVRRPQWPLFSALLFLSFAFKFHVLPGFHGVQVGGKFSVGFDSPLVGLFPLLLVVPLVKSVREGWQAVKKSAWLILLGLAVMTLLTLSSGTIQWEAKLPSYAAGRYAVNLLFVIAEEAFYRGFLIGEMVKRSVHWSAALLLSAALFTLAHAGWSPSLAIQLFVFLAGLLYGGVYLLSKRVESSIVCHYVLNILHMTFFSYHAM